MLPCAAHARPAPSLWDLVQPDRLVARAVQTGIMALRSQFDIVYGGISVDAVSGSLSLTDVRAWPVMPWPADRRCELRFDRIAIDAAPVDQIDRLRFSLTASGGTASLDCLPPPARPVAGGLLGLDRVSLSQLTADVSYRISTAAATTHVFARADGLASVTLDSDFDYLWFDSSARQHPPAPVAYLKSARLEVANLGLWDTLRRILPAHAVDPQQAPATVQAFLSRVLPLPGPVDRFDPHAPAPTTGADLLPGATPMPLPPDHVATEQRQALAASADSAWRGFLKSPSQLVLETGFDPAEPRYLNLHDWERDSEAVLDDLEPRVRLASSARAAILPTALLETALQKPQDLGNADRLRVGRALATGIGAPRDLAAAGTLLQPLLDGGNGEAALLLAQAQEPADPAAAYSAALVAAAAGADGAAGLLDRLEAEIPLATVLQQQAAQVAGLKRPSQPLKSIPAIRDEAAMWLSGKGRPRSYSEAETWALIGAAAGDAESRDMLDRIDRKMRYADAAALKVWDAQKKAATQAARTGWIRFDLPAAFGATP